MAKTRRSLKKRPSSPIEEEEETLPTTTTHTSPVRFSPPIALSPLRTITTMPPSALKTGAKNKGATTTKKRARLMFSPEPPKEHEFAMHSPPVRRLDLMRQKGDLPKNSFVLRLEMEERGIQEDKDKVSSVMEHQVKEDLKKELLTFHGLSCTHENDFAAMREMLDLARSIRRKAELRLCGLSLPHESSLKDVQKSLWAHRIHFENLTHSKACEALEHAMLKEDVQGLKGEGYQFGRRLVSALDIVSFEHPSDKDLRKLLAARAEREEQAQAVSSESQSPIRKTSSGKLNIPRTKAGKLEMIARAVETDQETIVRVHCRQEMERELERRNCVLPSSESRTYYDDLFQTIYSLKNWRENYEDVDCVTHVTDEEIAHETALAKAAAAAASAAARASSPSYGEDGSGEDRASNCVLS